MKPFLPEDAQAAPGYYLLPDDVLVHVIETRNGRTIGLRYFPDAPAAADGPWVFQSGLSRALAHLEPMRPRDAVRVAGRLMGRRAA